MLVNVCNKVLVKSSIDANHLDVMVPIHERAAWRAPYASQLVVCEDHPYSIVTKKSIKVKRKPTKCKTVPIRVMMEWGTLCPCRGCHGSKNQHQDRNYILSFAIGSPLLCVLQIEVLKDNEVQRTSES